MKRFIIDNRGIAVLWVVFLMLVLCALSVLVYSGATIYSKYRLAQTELERAASICVDHNMINCSVRDLVLDIPAESTVTILENNLAQSGYVKSGDNCWQKNVGNKLIYSFDNMQIAVFGEQLDITATFTMPMPWDFGILPISIPIHVLSKVLYLN